MAKRAKPEEFIAKLREVEVRLSRGETAGQAARAIGVTEQTIGGAAKMGGWALIRPAG
jgi:putative transposase